MFKRSTFLTIGVFLFFAFLLPSKAQSVPGLSAPVNGSTWETTTPTLYWWYSPTPYSAGPFSYTVQVSTNQTIFTGLNLKVNTTVSAGVTGSYAVTTGAGLVTGTTYYWRVGVGSVFSTVSGFTPSSGSTATTTAPAAPVPSSPTYGETNVSVSPTFSWYASGADSYRLQVSLNSSFSSFVINQSGITSASYAASGLTNSTVYYWRVNATNTYGTSDYSYVSNFTTEAAAIPPSTPTLATPANSATNISNHPTLYWHPASGATTYTLKVSHDNFSSTDFTFSSITDTAYHIHAWPLDYLQLNTQYYWKVSATNTYGTSAYSSVWSFTTKLSPDAPDLVSPLNNMTDLSILPTLVWTKEFGATSYDLQVATNSSFTTGLQTFPTIADTTYTLTSQLTVNTIYYWRVRSNAGSSSAYTSYWRFKTAEHTTWYVSTGGFNTNSGLTSTDAFLTIQHAIGAASNGDIINVAAGMYDEQVVINGINLTLQGAGDGTIIRPSAPSILTTTYTYPALTFWPGVVMASTILIENTSATVIKNIKVDGVNVTSLPPGSSRLAGVLYGESSGTIDNVTITTIKTTGYVDRSYGIDLSAVSGTHTVEVKNCNISDWSRNGIQAQGANLTASIHDNTLVGPGSASLSQPAAVPNGILFIQGVGGNATSNTIHALHTNLTPSRSAGILFYGTLASGIVTEYNDIYDVDDGVCLSAGASNVIIRLNNLHNNLEVGVHLEDGATQNLITDNTITNNSIAGIRLGGALEGPPNADTPPGTGNVAHGNNISGNTVGVLNWDTQIFDAINNWWGDATGPLDTKPLTPGVPPYNNPTGLGNPVSSYVDYNPWITGTSTLAVGSTTTVTGATVSIPVTLGAYGLSFQTLQGKFTYDPAKLDYISASYGTGTLINASGWIILFNESPAGTINFVGVGFTPIASSGTLFKLNFKVIALTAGSANISVNDPDFKVDGTPSVLACYSGTITYTFQQYTYLRGDVDLDGNVDLDDALLLDQYLSTLISLSTLQKNNADANLDGSLDSEDISAILYYVLYGGSWPVPPPAPSVVNVSFGNAGNKANNLIDLPIELNSSSNVRNVEMIVNYDKNAMDFQTFSQLVNKTGHYVDATKIVDGIARFTYVAPVGQTGNFTPGSLVMRLKNSSYKGGPITTFYKVNGGEFKKGPTFSIDGVTSVETNNSVPTDYELTQNYPNPFNPTTRINYSLPQNSYVTIRIYNMLGQEIKTLVQNEMSAGIHAAEWRGDSNNGNLVASGIYIYRLTAGKFIATKKMLYLK